MREEAELILLRRFSTFVGAGEYVTAAVDVRRYSQAEVWLWRGVLIGSTATVGITVEESMDGAAWAIPSGGSADVDPGEDQEQLLTLSLGRSFIRARVNLQGTNPAITCYARGRLFGPV